MLKRFCWVAFIFSLGSLGISLSINPAALAEIGNVNPGNSQSPEPSEGVVPEDGLNSPEVDENNPESLENPTETEETLLQFSTSTHSIRIFRRDNSDDLSVNIHDIKSDQTLPNTFVKKLQSGDEGYDQTAAASYQIIMQPESDSDSEIRFFAWEYYPESSGEFSYASLLPQLPPRSQEEVTSEFKKPWPLISLIIMLIVTNVAGVLLVVLQKRKSQELGQKIQELGQKNKNLEREKQSLQSTQTYIQRSDILYPPQSWPQSQPQPQPQPWVQPQPQPWVQPQPQPKPKPKPKPKPQVQYTLADDYNNFHKGHNQNFEIVARVQLSREGFGDAFSKGYLPSFEESRQGTFNIVRHVDAKNIHYLVLDRKARLIGATIQNIEYSYEFDPASDLRTPRTVEYQDLAKVDPGVDADTWRLSQKGWLKLCS
jgi:hypothetical protein